MLEETRPPGASQRCQICWRGQALCREVWDVKSLPDPAIASGKEWKDRDAGRLGCPPWTRRAGPTDAVRGHVGDRWRGAGLGAGAGVFREVTRLLISMGGDTAPYLHRRLIRRCRLSRTSSDTCSFSHLGILLWQHSGIWDAYPGSQRGRSQRRGSPVTLASLPLVSLDLWIPTWAILRHTQRPGPTTTTLLCWAFGYHHPLPLGQRPSRFPPRFPNQTRGKEP